MLLRFSFRAVVFTIAQHFTRTLFTTDVEGHNQTREQQHRSQFHRQYVRPEQRNTHCFSTDWRTVDTLIINTKDGVNNLMGIYACCTGKTFDEIEAEFSGKGYGDFKSAVAEAVVAELAPVKETFDRLIADKAYLNECMAKGAEQAARVANKTLRKVMRKVGFYQL